MRGKMMIKSIKMQLAYMLRSKSAVVIFFILMVAVGENFYTNINRNYKTIYVTQMFDLVKMLTLSEWTKVGYFFMHYYPILVVIPTAFVYLSDKRSGMDIYMIGKVGKKNYLFGKMISVFLITFIVFTIPFITELVLSMICFDVRSVGDPSNFEYFQTIVDDGNYFLSSIYLHNRILYAVILILLFGIISAILAVFNFAINVLFDFRYRIATIWSAYVLLYLIKTISKFIKPNFTLYYVDILKFFDDHAKRNYLAYTIITTMVLFISIAIIRFKTSKRDFDILNG